MATVTRCSSLIWSFPYCSSSVSEEKMKENFKIGKSKMLRNQHWQKTNKDKEFVANNHELYHAVILKHDRN